VPNSNGLPSWFPADFNADEELITALEEDGAPEIEQYASPADDAIELRFNPAELRDTRGRWTRFGGVGDAADVMMKNREGFSVSVRSGGEPVTGYMVAQTDHTHTYPEDILDDHARLTRAIDDMLVKEKAAFAGRGDVYLGGWVHDGKLWLEPSDNIASRDEAESEGRGRNQIAIWDVDNGEEIQTGGSGGGQIYEHANPQDHNGTDPGELRGPARGAAAGIRGGAGFGPDGGAGDGVSMDTIVDQLDLSGTEGIIGQLIDLAGRTPAWVHEKRDAHGQWARGSGGPMASARRSASMTVGTARPLMQQAQANRAGAQTAVAQRVAEEKARQALDAARQELDKTRKELEENARSAENQKHRTKLAVHALLVTAGAILAAIMAHYDISPVLAAFAGAGPLLGIELTDWRKKL
jgi:hypothetical protein